ncbi:MAG: Gfo/Idh/MocA family oxidoreductase [Verrucomicrobia bacterium]|nr:Gfo/Idh/MocA family oxidoreductase [Verrucomicrobiota bacterium]
MAQKGQPLRFGVVGLGNIADFHARAAAGLRGGKLHSCFGRSAERAAAFAERHNCQPYSSLRKFLADDQLDVVTICTPSGAHLPPAVAAARAGKHVGVEKPLEITPARCRRLIAACRENRVKLVTVFQSRFKDVNRVLKEALLAKRIGKPVSGSIVVKWYRPQSYYDSGAWRGTWDLDGGGCLMNQGIHSVDLLLWLMGDVAEVSATMSRPSRQRIEVETNLVATLKFKNGALGTIEASTEIYPGYPHSIQISGTRGTVAACEENLVHWDFEEPRAGDAAIRRKFAATRGGSGGSANPLDISYAGHQRQFQELVDVIQGRQRRLTCDGAEGIRSVALIGAIYRSARSGKTIKLR